MDLRALFMLNFSWLPVVDGYSSLLVWTDMQRLWGTVTGTFTQLARWIAPLRGALINHLAMLNLDTNFSA
jgi:hypothetical protein